MTNNKWTDNDKELRWFYNGAVGFAVGAGLFNADHVPSPDLLTDEKVLALISDFTTNVKPLSAFREKTDAAKAFKLWVGRGKQPVKPKSEQTITCQITRNLGDISVTFGWTGQFQINKASDLPLAYRYAIDMVDRQFSDWGAGALPAGLSTPLRGGEQTETFFGDSVVSEAKDGKVYHKIVGGKYTKFGVRVWPETLKDAGIDTDELTPDEPFMLKRDVTIIMDGEKPVKVISIS